MDKNAIKKYAVWARRELISRVTQRALKYGISGKEIIPAKETSIHGVALSPTEIAQRTALISQINNKGFEQVMEEVAYTWFNRFSALRFMEVNGYLPTHVRVFTDDENSFKPQIMAEAINLEMDGLDMEKVYAMKDANDNDALFKYLIITQCNALSSILPGMFQKIDDYTELLFPDNLLREGSAIEQMISLIPEDDWKDQVQIIGWLYQYYNTEPKDKVFADLKKNIKISKENIPAATQLFTPDWIVRYMVENSLGRLWLEGHPNTADQLLPTKEEQEKYIAGDRNEDDHKWHYYLEEAEQEPDVKVQLDEIRKEYASLKPEDIKCIDPCSGSGHILAYMFDVLVRIYKTYGYTAREAAASIVENNLYGLDIDDRAAQLAYFSVMMKARQYDRRFFNRGIQPHVLAIKESNNIDKGALAEFIEGNEKIKTAMNTIMAELFDAKEYGSIINVSQVDYELLYRRFEEIKDGAFLFKNIILDEILPLVQVAEALAEKYHTVVTNPPYMGAAGMGSKLTEYVKKKYPNSKSDLFAVFMQRADEFVKMKGYTSLITMESWMFLSSFEKLRKIVNDTKTIINMVHMPYLGKGGTSLGINFGTAAVIMKKGYIHKYKGQYEYTVYYECDENGVPFVFPTKNERWKTAAQCEFAKIPGSPVAYWVSEAFRNIFGSGTIYDFCSVQEGLKTGDNNRFIRNWYEVDFLKTNLTGDNTRKWIYHTKGGDFNRWYGNRTEVLNYRNDGEELKKYNGASLTGAQNYFKKAITYNRITSGKTSFRYTGNNSIPNMAGLSIYPQKEENFNYLLGWLNTTIISDILAIINPTLNYPPGTIGSLPVKIDNENKDRINQIVDTCVDLSHTDWDSFETSWDFTRHPLVRPVSTVEDAYTAWQCECNDRFNQLKSNEEELNRIFIDIYGLQDELTPEVEEKDVTVRKADLQRDIKSLISYAVGCMFGRYSPDREGLVFAGGEWNSGNYKSFPADKDNIIPISDDEYFEDDIVNCFVDFIRTVYGENSLDENLKFIANALGGKGHPKDVIRNYFLNDFYADHLKIYQKRPIYWLFDSGKKNGFKCLIYMHRYQPDTIARIRTDYVHEQQSRYRTSIADLEKRVASASTSEKVKLTKQLSKLQDQAAELHEYEEKIHHLADQYISIDLDDGVKVNYAKFQDVLAKIK